MKKVKEHIYIALNKPKGYVCALKDNLHPTIIDLIDASFKNQLHIVGRLDIDTTGIVILTNDGNYTHNATHPKKHVLKTYKVLLRDSFKDEYINEITSGMYIDHGETKLLPGQVEKISDKECFLTISEGKFHQVKKMFAALGNEVIELERVVFDTFDLRLLNIEQGKWVQVIKK